MMKFINDFKKLFYCIYTIEMKIHPFYMSKNNLFNVAPYLWKNHSLENILLHLFFTLLSDHQYKVFVSLAKCVAFQIPDRSYEYLDYAE